MCSTDFVAVTVTVADAAQVLALIGDLAMGQPPGHAVRAARLAVRIAALAGASPVESERARMVALLRWTGSTANAAGFAALMGDDVRGRHAMLTRTLPARHPLTFSSAAPLAQIHCEVAGDIARMLGLPAAVEESLRHSFERIDGSGMPLRLRGAEIPEAVSWAALAGDVEILFRAHGLDTALRLIGQFAGRKYPAALVQRVAAQARGWLDTLHDDIVSHAGDPASPTVPLTLVADVLELKLPWLAGYSRRVAGLASHAARQAGLSAARQDSLRRAALLHGVGRAGVPNAVWQRPGRLRPADWEQVRRVPYWTARVALHVPALAAAARLASGAYERLDGSGYHRRLVQEELDTDHRLLAAAAAWTALCSPRPWRAAYDPAAATALLAAQAVRFDRAAVDAVIAAAHDTRPPAPARGGPLSAREVEVLRRVSTGEGTRDTARALRISPAAVRTHMESILAHLGCTTRAAATLKALTLDLM